MTPFWMEENFTDGKYSWFFVSSQYCVLRR